MADPATGCEEIHRVPLELRAEAREMIAEPRDFRAGIRERTRVLARGLGRTEARPGSAGLR